MVIAILMLTGRAQVLPSGVENPKGIIHSDEAMKNVWGRYTDFPECPNKCLPKWHGDGWCDESCNIEECGFDNGDCDRFCKGECLSSWVGDGFCDPTCYNEICDFDGGDCKESDIAERDYFPLTDNAYFDFDECPKNCLLKRGDEICDTECDIEECNWDGLDCLTYHCSPYCHYSWLGDGECDPACDTGACGYDKGDCTAECAPGCNLTMLGNSFCDGACQNEECNWDSGDCNEVCKSYPYVRSYDGDTFIYPHCRQAWLGDGACDCWCYNEECNYDYGDCGKKEDKEGCLVQIANLEEALAMIPNNRKGGDYPNLANAT